MSPGGLNSVVCGVAGEDGPGEPGERDGTAGLVGAGPAEVGAVVDVGEEPHPVNTVSASALVARPAVSVEGMPSTLGTDMPAPGQREVSTR
jgi:hypothetical protein